MTSQAAFEIGGTRIAPGTRQSVELPVSQMPDHTPVTMPVHVVHGKRPGPVMFVSAAIHGDEVIGVEVVRRLLRAKPVERLAGTLLAVPIVNSFGFLNHSRYLPDRRDLNRCFPGHASGSLAARLAHLFMTEIVARSDIGIDLHSAAIRRENLPQIRLTPGNKRLAELGRAFGAPVMLQSKLREGSLRHAAEDMDCDVLLYEAGEGLRFDEYAARAGLSGVLRVMHALDMIGARGVPQAKTPPLLSERSSWLRAPLGGLLRTYRTIGDYVSEGEVLGVVADPAGDVEEEIISDMEGIIIGRTNMPVVNEGDALFHIALTPSEAVAEAVVDEMSAQREAAPLFDEDEII
ncbi:succinylglutamate desuccinylase/aspartoacylase family protein [Marinovum sp. 2_MG-2023]|uniref:succinylglutamate desuccinylase/aspartoacylase family protein n=1 Tax=unclassified Marinovum TaxID=2647166 RepID=UPI0026E41F40|nr:MULTISPECIES: succinylglutamate desuccinylase/aspartoacylase family protein [unclassified Marinovum]MDO6730331.1 succinylglutamate desuccinylase/aspartoacylase family protein [Marinovum sp. 2_MG-2023]MDO6779069.1 succinylglutamate desuccinylase/aspartoacylase family protein [Marinovum sp. 1_MG-2023]